MEGVLYLNSKKNILVCVTQQKTCERLIRKAAKIKANKNMDLFVIHVVKDQWKFLDSASEGEALEYLFGISKSVGANLTVLRSNNIVDTISEFTIEHNISQIFIGQSPNDHSENNFYNELRSILDDVEISVIPQDES